MKIVKTRLADQVAEKIQEMIAKGTYKAGDKIPIEKQLAEMFSVSRITIREAFVKLEIMGIVDIRQGEGTFVRAVTPESFMKPLLPMLILDQSQSDQLDNLYNIYDARCVIEVKTSELAAKNATEEDLDTLSYILSELEENLINKDIASYDKNDFLFHLQIARCSKNPILYTILELIQDLLRYSIEAVSDAPYAKDNSMRYHKELLQLIRSREIQAAGRCMHEHLTIGANYVQSLMQNK